MPALGLCSDIHPSADYIYYYDETLLERLGRAYPLKFSLIASKCPIALSSLLRAIRQLSPIDIHLKKEEGEY